MLLNVLKDTVCRVLLGFCDQHDVPKDGLVEARRGEALFNLLRAKLHNQTGTKDKS